MNNKIFFFLLLLIAGSVFVSCEDRLANEFKDPEKHNPNPDEIVPGMFTQMLTRRFFVLDYGEWWWTYGGGFGIPAYAQISVRRPHPSEDYAWTEWSLLDGSGEFYTDMEASKRFNFYYTDLKNWGLIRDEIEKISGDELADNEIFFLTATVIKNVIGLQMVDNFNKIPYTEAFQGTKGIFFPKYDDGKEIYMTVLDELKELTVSIPQAHDKMSAKAKELFAKQDIAFGGDPQKWAQYANSVRLRHAMRMSGVDQEFAKTHVQDVANKLPATDFIWPNPHKNVMTIGRDNGCGIYVRALYEQAYNTLIPNVIMQRMNYGSLDYEEGEDDPRLPVIANPTRYSKTNWQYTGVSMDYDAQYPYWSTLGAVAHPDYPNGKPHDVGPGLTFRTYENYPVNIGTHWLNNGYSTYNIATFTYGEIPAYMNSRAENDLFLAEAVLKGLATTGKSAADHIKDAVVHSTDYWYKVNSYSVFWQNLLGSEDSLKRIFAPSKPSDAIINQFADKIKAEFEAAAGLEDKMEIIMQQKYIHHNIINIYELWAELRRTRHPRIEKLKVLGKVNDPIPERIKYPTTELQRNSTSFAEVINENNFTTPIFWVPDNKRSESYYMDGWLPLKGFLPLPSPNPNRP